MKHHVEGYQVCTYHGTAYMCRPSLRNEISRKVLKTKGTSTWNGTAVSDMYNMYQVQVLVL